MGRSRANQGKALAALEGVQDAAGLDGLRVKYLGKKGELTGVLKMMGKLSPEERPVMGQMANDVRAALENRAGRPTLVGRSRANQGSSDQGGFQPVTAPLCG